MRDVARSFAADASSASSSADASAVTGAVVDRARARGDRARELAEKRAPTDLAGVLDASA